MTANDPYFSLQTFAFLRELEKNNDRDWFKAHKDEYEQHVRDPFLAFIADAAAPLEKVSPNVVADPRPVGGSLFRIYRDVRFSRDKSPYKTHAGGHFRHVAGKDVHAPGFYLHIEPDDCFVGGGMWEPDAKALTSIRDAIVDYPDRWRTVLRSKPEFMMEGLKRAPRGYDPDHPFVEDLKRKSFVVGRPLADADVCDPGFMKTFISSCKSMNQLMEFLARAIGVPW